MRGKASCIVIVALAAALAVQAGGTVSEEVLYSQALGENRSVLVYLPEGYSHVGPELPVVYYLHGNAGAPGSWYMNDALPIIDDLISNGMIDPMIIVEPDSVSRVVPLTGTPGEGALYPSLKPGPSGLRQPSWALIDQLRSVDKRRVVKVFGGVSEDELAEIDDGIRLFLGLG